MAGCRLHSLAQALTNRVNVENVSMKYIRVPNAKDGREGSTGG